LVSYLYGDDAKAKSMFLRSLNMSRRSGYESQIGYALLGLALTAARSRDLAHAAELHGAVAAFFDRLGEQLQDLEFHLRETSILELRSNLDSSVFDAAYAAGAALSRDQILALAAR